MTGQNVLEEPKGKILNSGTATSFVFNLATFLEPSEQFFSCDSSSIVSNVGRSVGQSVCRSVCP